MGKRRPKLEPNAPWEQLSLRLSSDEQFAYERIRPIVLFGESLPARAEETQIAERSLRRQVVAFEQDGMRSLFPVEAPQAFRELPLALRDMILTLHADHPPMRPHEIATICFIRTGRHLSPHTVKRLIAAAPPRQQHQRRFPLYHQISDPFERRRAIVRLHLEDWNRKSIAGYLGINRSTVYDTLRRWFAEGLRGLANKSRARRPRVRKVTFQAIEAVRKLQRNPLLGAWRIAAALKQQGTRLSPRMVGRIMARNRDVYALTRPYHEPTIPKPMPYAASRRHQWWTVDIRYVDMHQLGGGTIYCISILENYSRAIIASALTRTQDLAAYLMVLYAAVHACGSPEGLVSDSGSVFRAKRAQAIYQALGIRKEYIAKRQPWQSYIETAFGVQRRMADFHFAEATTWEELVAAHDRWVADYNYQDHWFHRARPDERFSPAAVLAWVRGQTHEERRLQRILYTLRFTRRVDRYGFVRFRHWRVYSESGLIGHNAVLWLHKETLTVTFAEQPLASYSVKYARRPQEFESITNSMLYTTQFRSPQLTLWDIAASEWYQVLRVQRGRPRLRPHVPWNQLAFPLEAS